ncbi:MAG: hypothetical protein SPK85_08765 [Prevotella sp.]|nr:hypothetical protein [Prevotella sp.]
MAALLVAAQQFQLGLRLQGVGGLLGEALHAQLGLAANVGGRGCLMWVVGVRTDNRYRITGSTKEAVVVSIE